MLVSAPGTIVIFTQMSGLAALNASTMCFRESESGGVWLVQNLTSVAVVAQAAPVTGVGSALAPAACDAPALALAAADAAGADAAGTLAPAEAAGLELVLLQADTTRTIEAIATDDRNRPIGRMAPPSLFR
jgi:hypothetical protein